jgi:DNA-binding response OmpR family regulator
VVAAAEVIAAVRRYSSVPIAVGVGAGEIDHATEAIAVGATQILSRPYRPSELRTLLNPWLGRARARWDRESVIRFGSLEVDSGAYEVRAAGKPLKFTLREFELLRLLVLHADRVVTRDQIRRDVWRAAGEVASANTIAVHIRRIRVRLDGAAEVISVRGIGYRLTVS